jgi:hypothetical protein
MAFKLATLAAAISLAACAATARAANLEDIFTVRGYATLGVVHSDEENADFTAHVQTQSEGAGASDEFSFDIDSKFGVQLDINITPRLSGVLQLISEANDNNSWNGEVNKDYQPSLEWANLSYRVTDDLTLRGGRIVLPFLMVSEYRKVGYANHWLRPPVEVYGLLPFSSSDGGDISYRSSIGNAINTARVHYGVQTLRTVFKAQVKATGINDTLEIGALSLRGAFMQLEFSTPGDGFAPLIDAFTGIASALPGGIGLNAAAEAARLENTYDPAQGQRVKFTDLAVSYDPGPWFAMAEVVRTRSGGFLGNIDSGYVSAGIRWNTLTPYATYAAVDTEARNERGIPLTGLPPQLRGIGGVINGIVTGLANRNSTQHTLSLGLRWDVVSNFALKAQFDHVDLGAGSGGLLRNEEPDLNLGSSVNVIGVAVDYVF